MKILSRLSGVALLSFGLCWPATAQIGPRGGGALVVAVCGTLPLAYKPGAVVTPTQDINGNACISGTFSATGGTISNATSAQATSGTNQGSVSYNYGFNGTTWDQLQVDASKNLNINCQAGCAGGATSNAGSGVATSSTNGKTVNYNYGWNGTTWDQVSSLTVGSKHALTSAIVDGSGNQITSFGATGSTSNASSGVATAATNVPTVGYGYGFNGTTWDQLQVDASKRLIVGASSGAFVDGALATLGTEAETAWNGTGSGTLIAIERYIAASVNSGIAGNGVTAAS